ncbi:glycosyltransferase family 2 protein [Pontibacter akesuensis]|uniref:Glycosyl transferase family 2 n=1 Tax=Pontibacter akesuensis TaxID=388950 RepID=A0A1I7GIJ4_9BACT|nr:glycosyltransferase [Pontibacter akesuensis]GHA56676.1 hypothetical protein GCM10007389_05390 [Pontibacter akesuensis]SFU48131.1 Glycosyl transferase family 2 [Pontibacter akesuensis]
MAKVTVLMPVYNAEKFLAEAMYSILVQTFPDFEFLIIDDASTDNSALIIQSYSDPRIRFYQNRKNLGVTATLNAGIELASCELIARMDADDISYPYRLEKQYQYLLAHPDCSLVSSLARVITEEGETVRVDNFASSYFYYNLTFICWIYHSSVMYRKAAVLDVGKYPTSYGEDYELWSQLMKKYKLANLPEVLLDYRLSSQSLTSATRKQENEQAGREQTLRNLRYYAGGHYNLPDDFLACFRHNFAPLLKKQRVDRILDCLRELDFITACILQKENINRNKTDIKAAAKYKRRFILSFYARNLPRHKGAALLLRDKSFLYLLQIACSHLARKFGRSVRLKGRETVGVRAAQQV